MRVGRLSAPDGNMGRVCGKNIRFGLERFDYVPVAPVGDGVDCREQDGVQETVQNECLNHFVVFGERHLEYLLRDFEDHYNTVRPHQGLGNRTIGIVATPPSGGESPVLAEIECASRLGGLLRHYHRKAA